AALFSLDVEASEIVRLVRRGHPRVVCSDRSAEPSRSGMNEQPEASFRIAVKLEEVIATAEGPEVPPSQRLAGVFERPRRQGPGEDGAGHVDAMSAMARVPSRDRAAQRLNNRSEFATVEGPRIDAYPERGHAASKIASESTRNDHPLRREDAAHGDPL